MQDLMVKIHHHHHCKALFDIFRGFATQQQKWVFSGESNTLNIP